MYLVKGFSYDKHFIKYKRQLLATYLQQYTWRSNFKGKPAEYHINNYSYHPGLARRLRELLNIPEDLQRNRFKKYTTMEELCLAIYGLL